MKLLSTYLLLVLFSIQTFETALISLNFTINQDYFASICTNKDKPEMECNGKCHLKKQIKQHEEEKSSEENLTQKEFQLFIQWLDIINKKNIASGLRNQISYSEPLHSIQYSFDIFHPPKSRITS